MIASLFSFSWLYKNLLSSSFLLKHKEQHFPMRIAATHIAFLLSFAFRNLIAPAIFFLSGLDRTVAMRAPSNKFLVFWSNDLFGLLNWLMINWPEQDSAWRTYPKLSSLCSMAQKALVRERYVFNRLLRTFLHCLRQMMFCLDGTFLAFIPR